MQTSAASRQGAKGNGNTDTINLTEGETANLEKLGISLEEFLAMSPENQQVRLDELRVIMGQETTSAAVPTQKVYTVENVAAGGMYMVRIGDGWLNNYYLYYEDGEPVKVEISFQNNYEEEAEKYTFEGDSLEDFWYYGKTLQELISYFADSGYGYETIIYPMD